MPAEIPAPAKPPLPPGQIELEGHIYMVDAKAHRVPLEHVKQQDLLQDETVRSLVAAADKVAEAIAAFKRQAFDDVDAFNALIGDRYGVTRGGAKGNITLTSYDGCMKVQVQVADRLDFGPELQAAKALVDECLEEWSSDARAEIRSIVMDAFDVDQEGKINRSKLFQCLRYDITEDRWVNAMQALRDSIRVIGSGRFIRFYRRAGPTAEWQALSLDVATA